MFDSPQINFYVEDVELTARFYQESFGFTETFRTPDQGPPIHVELRLGQFTLGVADIDALRQMHGIVAGAGRPRAELVIWTEDVDRRVCGPRSQERHNAQPAARFPRVAPGRLGRGPRR